MGIYKKTYYERRADFENELREVKNLIGSLSCDEKIKKLKSISQNKMFDNFQVSKEDVRKFHNNYKYQWFKEWKICFVCRHHKVEHIHHIVMVKNGGTNDEENIIGICKKCHCLIHEWM